jgi:hypothetical protein
MGCCVQRNKFENDEETFLFLNSLPTYENIHQAYQELQLPYISEESLPHKKERLIIMIVNMLRVKPKIFLT